MQVVEEGDAWAIVDQAERGDPVLLSVVL